MRLSLLRSTLSTLLISRMILLILILLNMRNLGLRIYQLEKRRMEVIKVMRIKNDKLMIKCQMKLITLSGRKN